MALVLCLILGTSFFVPGACEDLSCLLADDVNKVVWSIGVTFPGLYAEYFASNPITDVCRGKDRFFTSSSAGHVNQVDISGVAEEVFQFSAMSTAIECDNSSQLVVVANKNEGISACAYDGSQCWSVVDIAGSDVKNLFIDACTRTCYFVDQNTNSVYAVDYRQGAANANTPIGTALSGAVGCAVNSVDGNAYLYILYSDCRVERCPIGGPFTGCPSSDNLRDATGGNCVAMSSTADYIITYDIANKFLDEIKVSNGQVITSIVDVDSVSGMDCSCDFCENDGDDCTSAPCLHGGKCVDQPVGYYCECVSGFEGLNCETGPPELVEIAKNVEVIKDRFSEADFAPLVDLFFDDVIFDFDGLPQLIGPAGYDIIVSLGVNYTNVEVLENEYRQLCDICYEHRSKSVWNLADGTSLPARLLRVWCFDFESKEWKVKSVAGINDYVAPGP